MLIRTATIEDLDAVTAVEAECFPPAEAATRADFEHRLSHYASHFWLMFDENKLIAFVDGMVTDEADLTDGKNTACAELHEKRCLADDFRRQHHPGIPQKARLCRRPHQTRHLRCKEPRAGKGLVLTCKDKLIHYYAQSSDS